MARPEAGEGAREGLYAAIKNTLATLLAIGKTRVELLVTELQEEKLRLVSLAAKAVAGAFLLAMGVIMAVFFLALVFWEQRLFLFGLLAALFIGGALLLLSSVKRQMAEPSKLLRSSLNELEADVALLKRRAREGAE